MRRRIAGLVVGLLLAAAPPALAAPTCWNAAGETVRCEAAGALPVGSTLTAAQQAARRARSSELKPVGLIGLIAVLGGLVALLALMPEFDGWERER